jgi:undecaprenyl-diphosphatase
MMRRVAIMPPANRFKEISTISVFSLVVFLLIATSKGEFSRIDGMANAWAASVQSWPLTQAALAIHYGFDTIPLIIVSLLIAAYLFKKGRKDLAIFLILVMLVAAAMIEASKAATGFQRPMNSVISEEGFSFPSGHVVSTVVLLGLVAYFFQKYSNSSKARMASLIFFAAMSLIVGMDRIYLNVHWLSDVLGGYALGAFWLSFSILAFEVTSSYLRLKSAESRKR